MIEKIQGRGGASGRSRDRPFLLYKNQLVFSRRESCTDGLAPLVMCLMKRRLALLALCLLPAMSFAESPATAPKVKLKTNLGEIVLELNPKAAPVTVENFLGYVKKKHYDGTVFHRVINGFMIQGGGFANTNGKLTEKPSGKGIVNESQNGLKNDAYTIAMARTSDPNSATAQFFINVSNNAMLNYPSNGGYAVFGKVISGQEVVDKIKSVSTTTATLAMIHPVTGQKLEMPAQDVPVEKVVIESATVVE